jgi:predicted nucleic acid-binding protein
MRIVVDTNWLVATYFSDKNHFRTQIVRRFIDRLDAAWIVPLPALLEARNIFALSARTANGAEWKVFQSHLGTQIIIPDVSWEEVQAKTEELSDRYSARVAIGTLDLMILATALKCEATHFLSFDTNSNARALASVLKLKVFPDLTADDKRRVAALR